MKKTDKSIEYKVIELYNNGQSCKNIAQQLSINSVTAFNILKRNNIDTRTKGGIYKLPVDYIINEYNNGVRIVEIADKLNVNPKTIYNYLESAGIPRNYIYINQSLRRDYFENIDSYDKAYFLGFIISDGCVTEDNNLSICIRRDDYYILEILRQKMLNDNPLYYPQNRNEVTFHCKSSQLLGDLAKYGVVPRKSLISFIPEIDEMLLHHMIRGLFDGNGWISYKAHQFGFCAGNEVIVTQFRDILVSRLNVYPVKIIHSSPNTYQCTWSSSNDIMKFFGYIYNLQNECFLVRKYENFMKIPS